MNTYLLHLIGTFYFLFMVVNCSQPIQSIKPSTNSTCQKISGTPGPEDIELVKVNQKSYIIVSSHERRIENTNGKLFFINPDPLKESFNSVPLNVDRYPENFRPHGISTSKKNGKLRLYAISHPGLENKKHTIEIFELKDEANFTWTYIGELTHANLKSPNDLFALPDERLIVSNDGSGSNSLKVAFDFIFNISSADITYYENGNFYLAGVKVPFGNGIWYEENGKEKILYRSSHLNRSIYVYDVNWIENYQPTLDLKYKIDFNGGPDNIIKNEYGFYTAIHPSNYLFLRHVSNPKNLSPTQVFKITNSRDTKLIYSNVGDEISAGSTGLVYKNTLFISQVFEDFVLACGM
jgi:arylesterase/paraoxonase